MNDLQLGLALRAMRIKRHLRQCDLARQAGVSASVVSRLEHGDMGHVSLPALRGVAERLGVSLEFRARSSGGDLDRVVSARHAALGERVAGWIARQPGWRVVGEVSFSIYGERGVVDLLAWHETAGSVVVIELKTAIVDVDELIGTLDRKRRLATRIAADRGWTPRSVSAWLIVGDSRTNRRRVAEHRNLLASALPRDGRSLATVFRQPERGLESGIAFWPNLPASGVGREIAGRQRVVKRNRSVGPAPHARVWVQQVVTDPS